VVTTEAVEVAVPAAVSELSLLERVDYEDAFQIDTPGDKTPEAWMRAIIAGAPPWFQLPWINLLGRGILRAQIGPMHAPGYVLGWEVLLDRPEVFVVGLDGADGFRARLITVAPGGRAVFATQIRFGSLLMRTFWPAIRPGHRFFAPYLLSRAATRLTTPDSPSRTGRPTGSQGQRPLR
jgi:hypothetical protein